MTRWRRSRKIRRSIRSTGMIALTRGLHSSDGFPVLEELVVGRQGGPGAVHGVVELAAVADGLGDVTPPPVNGSLA